MIRLRNAVERLMVRIYSRLARSSFRACGAVYLHPTARIDNPQHISLHDGVSIGRHVWLYAMVSDSAGRSYSPRIEIHRGTKIGDFGHITAAHSVVIGSDVLITRNVLITDSTHVYRDILVPIIQQGLSSRPTSIGDGCWLGNNAVVLGCSVGRHCVVGANSVVARDVPDFCVVAGAPARIVKRHDPSSGSWTTVLRDALLDAQS